MWMEPAGRAAATASAGGGAAPADARPCSCPILGWPALSDMVGFGNLVLSKTTDFAGAIQPVPAVPNFLVITSGPLPPNPSELLNAHQTVHVMKELGQSADLIVYDTQPVAAVTDAVVQ